MAQILLAETDKPIRDFIAGILVDFGHDVTACENCTEAAALLTIGPFEVVVTDLVLGEGEGSTLGRSCAARRVPTITLTGHEFRLDRAEQDRPLPLVDKPFRLDDLQCVVDAVALAPGSIKAAA
jgi:two-component system nitrogen regulation response regulator GlnG